MRVVVPVILFMVHVFLNGVYGAVDRRPSNGDITLNGTVDSSTGPLEIYYNGELLPVCLSGFSQMAANTACSQLGYNKAVNYSSIDTRTPTSEGSGELLDTPVFSIISCNSVQSHLLRCNFTVRNNPSNCNAVNLTCESKPKGSYLGAVRLSHGTYKSRGLLEIYLNNKWGTVCSEKFSKDIGSVICRQLGYTNAVTFGNYRPVDNERIVWLRDLKCNTTGLTCFKRCYDTPIIRNIYCGNEDDVELLCTFNTSLADIGSGSRETCEVEITEVHTGIIATLIVVFCLVFLVYLALFIGRFITAAWHKSDRYKVNEPERRYQFRDYSEQLKKNSLQLSEPPMIQFLRKESQQPMIVEAETEGNLSD